MIHDPCADLGEGYRDRIACELLENPDVDVHGDCDDLKNREKRKCAPNEGGEHFFPRCHARFAFSL